MAVTFAAATTLMGAGVLLFARHPALHSIGVTLVAGVGCGYLAAIGVVPVLCEWFGTKDSE
jgi:predicted RND superfamily exporter protein